jgi:hypothetical protein
MGVKSAPGRALRLEKPRASSHLNGDVGSGELKFDRRGAHPARRGKSHFGTVEDVSPWYGPRLTSPFAAQVIAQALRTPAASAASAQAAYRVGAARIPFAILLDDNI